MTPIEGQEHFSAMDSGCLRLWSMRNAAVVCCGRREWELRWFVGQAHGSR